MLKNSKIPIILPWIDWKTLQFYFICLRQAQTFGWNIHFTLINSNSKVFFFFLILLLTHHLFMNSWNNLNLSNDYCLDSYATMNWNSPFSPWSSWASSTIWNKIANILLPWLDYMSWEVIFWCQKFPYKYSHVQKEKKKLHMGKSTLFFWVSGGPFTLFDWAEKVPTKV